MRKLILALVAAALCAGCANSQPQPRLAKFDPAEYAPYEREGTGSVVGQAFVVTKGGDVKLGAGRQVGLHPMTSVSIETHERLVIGYTPLQWNYDEETLKRLSHVTRHVTADGNGRFRFDNLPAGEYYIACDIEWYVSEYQKSGGIAYAKVKVEEGKTTEAIVTRR